MGSPQLTLTPDQAAKLSALTQKLGTDALDNALDLADYIATISDSSSGSKLLVEKQGKFTQLKLNKNPGNG